MLHEAPPIRDANVPRRNAEGIQRHARARHVRSAHMIADVRWWKAKRAADASPRPERPTREIVKAKSAKRAKVHG